MAKDFLLSVVKDIKSLKIQGASQVRKQAVKAIKWHIQNSGKTSVKDFKLDLEKKILLLVKARPTEPGLRTAVRIILNSCHSSDASSVSELKSVLLETIKNYEVDRTNAMKRITEFGANKIKKASVVFTHCHSHTVEDILIRAWEKKKLKHVYCTETRPLFQGRLTAKALVSAGVPTTMVVDSAAGTYMREANYFFSGADAILEDGSVVNKIGTSLISLIASKENVPHFVASSSHKFDPVTCFGVEEVIEERDWKEIWDKKPKKLDILNPAFDVTDSSFIKGIVTEKGIFEPRAFALKMYDELELDTKRDEYLTLIKMMKK